MANTTKKNNSVKSGKKQVEKTVDYAKQIEELKKMVESLAKQNAELKESRTTEQNSTVYVSKEINPARMIKVISLCSNKLVLSQGEHGTGKAYVFPKLGTTRNIPANILDDIVSIHLGFAEKGYFYICDEDFVREHGLETDYQNLVNAEVIESLIKQDKFTIKHLLSSCKISQLNTILNVIAQKVINHEITIDELEDSGKLGIINRIYRDRKEDEDYDFRTVIENLVELSNPIKK